MDWFLYDNGLRHKRVKDFANLAAKHLCQSLFLIKLQVSDWGAEHLSMTTSKIFHERTPPSDCSCYLLSNYLQNSISCQLL